VADLNLDSLREHSFRIGQNIDLVQISGGNTSYKTHSRLWVKGSGYCLKNALKNDIFAEVDLSKLSDEIIFEVEDFTPYCLNEISPSIETNFHILLNSPFVTHLHSLGAISIGLSEGSIHTRFLESEASFLTYVRPGVNLARAIQMVNGHQAKILILQNHGAIFSGSTCREIELKIQNFELEVKDYFESLEPQFSFPNWIEILVAGVLTPDEAVFLGRKPFVESNISVADSVSINSDGELLFPETFSQDRIEMATFYVRVAKLIEKKTEVSYLPIEEVDSLLSWDKEKNRIELAK
jgi:rhamnose utilization protein RhaD (predicted bifunctional aldolase and dehydrogenase)